MMRVWIAFAVFASGSAHAYVSGAVGAHPGQWDGSLGVLFHRGLLGSEAIPETQIRRRASITETQVSLGRNWGDLWGLTDVATRVHFSRYSAAAELLQGQQIYGENSGSLITLETSFNLVRDTEKLLGFLLRLSHAADSQLDKFMKPKLDRVGLGIQGAYALSDHVGEEFLIYYGSGYFGPTGRVQNASLALSINTAFRGLFEGRFTLRVGPFLEADLTERNDAAYSLQGFRAFRAGLALLGSVPLAPGLGLELGYIQKFSGAYFTATQDSFLKVGFAF
jgi:hypothetical protein